MSIYFSTISKTVGNRARVIVPNPDRVVINIDLSVPKSLSSEYLYMMGSADIARYENLSDQNLMIVEDPDHPIPPELFSVNNLTTHIGLPFFSWICYNCATVLYLFRQSGGEYDVQKGVSGH